MTSCCTSPHNPHDLSWPHALIPVPAPMAHTRAGRMPGTGFARAGRNGARPALALPVTAAMASHAGRCLYPHKSMSVDHGWSG